MLFAERSRGEPKTIIARETSTKPANPTRMFDVMSPEAAITSTTYARMGSAWDDASAFPRYFVATKYTLMLTFAMPTRTSLKWRRSIVISSALS